MMCSGCGRPVGGDGGSCRRCLRLRLLVWVADDLEQRAYAFAPVVRQAAKLLAEVDDGGEVDRRCDECGGDLAVRATGRPARFCSGRCRQRAYRSRKCDESGHSAHVA